MKSQAFDHVERKPDLLLPFGHRSFRRSLLESAIQALPVGVLVHDAQGQCVLANSAALRVHEAEVGEEHLLQVNGAALAVVGGRALESEVVPIQSDNESYTLTTIVDITKHEQVQKALLGRAYLDSLTGLPNRALVEQCVEDLVESIALGDEFALAFIDLDSFKHINDYYSHAAGDALLQRVAERISHCLRPSDVLARIGGDEFVLLVTPVSDSAMAESLVREVAERLKAPFLIDGHEIFISASIGVSMFPSDGRTYDALRRRSDSAMYRAKSEVKGGVVFFREAMGQAATARMATEQRLRSAIRDKRFCCAFQPKVEMRTGEVQGIEVLLRWRDEQGLIQAPGDFVGLAVELGLINEIAFLVLSETVRSIDEIDEGFGPNVTISINVAAKQACDIEFMTSFVDALAATGFPERFTIELTEEAFLAKGRFQMQVLPCIRGAGIRVSIDDFGVGYSSLAALIQKDLTLHSG